MRWVCALLVICFTWVNVGAINTKNVANASDDSHVRAKRLDLEYADKRDSFTENNQNNDNAVSADVRHNDVTPVGSSDTRENDVQKRSVTPHLREDDDDIMTATVARTSREVGDTPTSNIDNREVEVPSYFDLNIGDNVPITMERRSELTADATAPDETFDDSASNIMIQNQESPLSFEKMSAISAKATKPLEVIQPVDAMDNLMRENDVPVALQRESQLSAAATPGGIISDESASPYGSALREKRDSIPSDTPFFESIVSPEITSLARNKNEGDMMRVGFDFDSSDDLMRAAVGDAHQEMKQKKAPLASEQESTLTAKSSAVGTDAKKKDVLAEVRALNTTIEQVYKKSKTPAQKHNHSKKKSATAHAPKSKHAHAQKKSKAEHAHKVAPVANHRKSELTARATSPKDTKSKSKNSKRSKMEGTQGELKSIFTEMRSAKHKLTRNDIRKLAKTAVMLAALKSNNGFDQAVKAEKRGHITKPKSKTTKKEKKKERKSSKKDNKKKTSKKSKTSHVTKDASEEIMVKDRGASPEMSFNTKDLSNQPEFTLNHNLDKEEVGKKDKPQKPQLDITVEQPIRNEFSEDTTKKSRNVGMSDDAMLKSSVTSPDDTTASTTTMPTTSKPMASLVEAMTDVETTPAGPVASMSNILATTPMPANEAGGNAAAADFSKELTMKVITDGNLGAPPIIAKKSEVARPEDDIEKAISDYDTSDLLAMIDNNNGAANKKNVVPTKEVSDSMTTLKSVLSKVSPNKVPTNFLPDIPAGLRMIAWKKLLEKKRSQLAEYESAVAVTDATAASDTTPSKADDVTTTYTKLGSDMKEAFAKKSPIDQGDGIKDLESDDNVSFMTVGTHDDNMETARHVHYLKKHISGARSLRKLIAKTLVGHCKSTGKRILSAFIAMDKALERAQAIATVIGGKFNVDPSKIENLVSDKEDQVVETFLRDIFTKL